MEMVWLFPIKFIFVVLMYNATAAPSSTSKEEDGLGASTWLGDFGALSGLTEPQ